MKKYHSFLVTDNEYTAIEEMSLVPKLPAGMYQVKITSHGQIIIIKGNNVHDGLIDLPNTEYDSIISELELFLKEDTKAKFKDNGFVYKRSTLLFGKPGTGKSSIINRMINTVIAKNGIVLFSPNPGALKEVFNILDSTQPEALVLVVFEELDQLVLSYESELLNLLDGEIQKNNVVYMATTNFINKVPARLMRPGRFSTSIEVGFPSLETREFYLTQKLKNTDHDIKSWASKTNGLSIDELKETVLAVTCLDQNLDGVIKKVLNLKKDKEYTQPESDNNIYDDDDWDESSKLGKALSNYSKKYGNRR